MKKYSEMFAAIGAAVCFAAWMLLILSGVGVTAGAAQAVTMAAFLGLVGCGIALRILDPDGRTIRRHLGGF